MNVEPVLQRTVLLGGRIAPGTCGAPMALNLARELRQGALTA